MHLVSPPCTCLVFLRVFAVCLYVRCYCLSTGRKREGVAENDRLGARWPPGGTSCCSARSQPSSSRGSQRRYKPPQVRRTARVFRWSSLRTTVVSALAFPLMRLRTASAPSCGRAGCAVGRLVFSSVASGALELRFGACRRSAGCRLLPRLGARCTSCGPARRIRFRSRVCPPFFRCPYSALCPRSCKCRAS